MDFFGWQRMSAGRFLTPEGVLDCNWDGAACIEAAKRMGWTRQLAKRDLRIQDGRGDEVGRMALNERAYPQLGEHLRWLNADNPIKGYRWRTAAGCAPDHRAIERLWPNLRCAHPGCSSEPSRRHMLWQCEGSLEHRTRLEIAPPRTGAEAGLMIQSTETLRRA